MSLTFTGPVPVPAHQTTPLRILITGASRGLGLEMVRQYGAAHKDNVIFAAVRDPNSKTTDKVKALAASNSNIHIVPLDIADEDSIRASVGHVSKLTDRLDLLINNAGVIGPEESKDVLKATSTHIRDVLAINVGGVMLTTQAYVPLLSQSKLTAKVVNVSSGVGSNKHVTAVGGVPMAVYGLSKAGLNYLNSVFAAAVPDVTFLVISPGFVDTDMGGGEGGPAPTKVKDSIAACRYYIDRKGKENSGEFVDIMTGELIPF